MELSCVGEKSIIITGLCSCDVEDTCLAAIDASCFFIYVLHFVLVP